MHSIRYTKFHTNLSNFVKIHQNTLFSWHAAWLKEQVEKHGMGQNTKLNYRRQILHGCSYDLRPNDTVQKPKSTKRQKNILAQGIREAAKNIPRGGGLPRKFSQNSAPPLKIAWVKFFTPLPTVNEQGVLTDILIELTKNNKFGLKSPAIARHLIIHNNIYQIGISFMENMQNLFLFSTSTSTTTSSSSRGSSKSSRYKCSNQFGGFTADPLVGHFGSVCPPPQKKISHPPPPRGGFGTFPKRLEIWIEAVDSLPPCLDFFPSFTVFFS